MLLIDLPYDVLGEIIKCLNQYAILNLRIVCKETNKMVSRYGTVLVKINSFYKIKKITEKNNKENIFRKIMFKLFTISKNLVGEGVEAICEALKVNHSLHTLQMYGNDLGNEGGKAICEALKVNNSLHTFCLRNNNLGVKAIGEALKVNNSLHTLDLWNNLGEESSKAIGEALKVNNSLHTLNIGSNNIGAEGGKEIGEALKFNNSLHTLCIGYNHLGDEGVIAIGEALKFNNSLHTLYIGCNNISVKVQEVLKSIANKKEEFELYL
jgi:Ran GTPase-activating protein (RanGAP) involved in mRNA processing and transport